MQAFETRMMNEDAVAQCYRVAPGPDFMLVVHVADMAAYHALAHRAFNASSIKSQHGQEFAWVAMFDEFVGPGDAFDGGVDAVVVEEFDDGCAEAVEEDVVFEGAEDFAFAAVFGEDGGNEGAASTSPAPLSARSSISSCGSRSCRPS